MKLEPDRKREEFAVFVREHQVSLRSFLRVIGVSSESVDDLAQDTFLVAYRDLDRFDQEEDFGKWLRGIARNLTRNELRKSARRRRIMNDELTKHLISEAETKDDGTGFEDKDFRALRDCIEQLPAMSRKLIAGRYADEWKAPFLADQLQMTATAVRLALMRIRRQLKSCMEGRISDA